MSMQRFVQLLAALETATHPAHTVHAIQAYANAVSDEELDAARSICTRGATRRVITTATLREWTCAVSGWSDVWLERCMEVTGNMGETCALILPAPEHHTPPSLATVMRTCADRNGDAQERMEWVMAAWRSMMPDERRVLNSILLGTFRAVIAEEAFDIALDPCPLPVPFRAVAPLPAQAESTLSVSDLCIEWLVEGSRVQVVIYGERIMCWDASNRLVADETVRASLLPLTSSRTDLILEGVIVGEAPHSRFVATDLLRESGVDLRQSPYAERRAQLRRLMQVDAVDELQCESWDDLVSFHARARELGYGGIMLKARDAWYGDADSIFAWHVAPYTFTAVLTYVQFISVYRKPAPLLICTFSVWKGAELIPVCKISDALRDDHATDIATWARKHIVDRFGPVRQVEAERVYEIGCTQISPAPRKKAGITLVNAHIIAERSDVRLDQIDTIDSISAQT